MKKIRNTFIALLLPALLSAQFGAGLQQGARQQGLGGSFTGLADDGEAVFYNPAGLVNLNNIEAVTMYSRQLGHLSQGTEQTGINVSYLGYAQNLGDKIGSFGIRHYYRGYDFGDVFNASEHIIMLGYGRKLGDLADLYPQTNWLKHLRPLSAGLGVKFMKYGFYDADALQSNPFAGSKSDLESWSWAMDLSLFYRLNQQWSFGFQFKDFNRPNSALIENENYLDRMDYSVGTAWRYGSNERDLITADMISENATYAFNLGTEKVWDFAYKNGLDEFILRTGGRIGLEEDYHWTIGAGYLLSKVGSRMDFATDFDLRFDYAYKVMFGNISDGPGNHCWELVFMLPAVKSYQEPQITIADDPDRDHDGILNLADKCPDSAEDKDGFDDSDGCPDPDNDRDGILDINDKCPSEPEDLDGFEDADGCPDLDNDGDAILDEFDKCPLIAEDKDGFEDADGCPDLDNDQDSIPDLTDLCPNEAETKNGFKDDDGCPDVLLQKNATITLKNVYFQTGKAAITPESYLELDKLETMFKDNPKLVIQIEGHTDNQGKKELNKKLSQNRAKAVRDYLIQKFFLAQNRIKFLGFGSEKPVADNKTPEGRAQNRRIEFKVLQVE